MTTAKQDLPFASMFSNLQDSAQFVTKMVTTMVEESDKQVAEGAKWMTTLNEHATNNRNAAMKLWVESMQRGASMGQTVVDQFTAAWRVQK